MALTDEQKSTFAKGFNLFLERTEQTKTEIAALLGLTPQVTSGWSRAISVPSYEICQKLLSLQKPMTVSEMFGDFVSFVQTMETANDLNSILDCFESTIFAKKRDLTIVDFQQGEYDYRKIIQDFVKAVVHIKEFPNPNRIEQILSKAKEFPNINQAIQAEMNWWNQK